MKSLTFALTSTLFIILIFALFIVGNLLFEYIKVNEKIKDENWELTQDNRQLEQLSNACAKKLKECKGDERKSFNQRIFTLPRKAINRIIKDRTINWNYVR